MRESGELAGNGKVVESMVVLRNALKMPGLTEKQSIKINKKLNRLAPVADYGTLAAELSKERGIDRAKVLDQLLTVYERTCELSAPVMGPIEPDPDAWIVNQE